MKLNTLPTVVASAILCVGLFAHAQVQIQEPQLEIAVPDISSMLEQVVLTLPPEVETLSCVSNRGMNLVIPSISGGILSGDIVLSRNSRVLVKTPPKMVTDVKTEDSKFSLTANDKDGHPVLKISGELDSYERYNVIVRWTGQGMAGFRCAK